MRDFRFSRSLAAAIGTLFVCFAFPASSDDAKHGAAAVTCTNPSSHANWQINIDYDHGTVDTHPASIGAEEIAWQTVDGEHYKLDRKSGNLTVIVASSTGGYFLHDHCKLDD